MAENTPGPPEAQDSQSPRASYDAVVFFHGMGRQRHYEELSRLIERLDQFIFLRHESGDADFPSPHLLGIAARQELARGGTGGDSPVAYIEAQIRKTDDSHRHFRFYEAYWAPETTGGTSVRAVIGWMVRQGMRPVTTLRQRWRGLERLRRADLVHLYEQRRSRDQGGKLRRQVAALIHAYSEFHQLDARRSYPKGRFRDFLSFLAATTPKDTDRSARLELARAWKSHHRRREMTNLFFVLSLLVGGVAALALLFVGLSTLLAWAEPQLANATLPPFARQYLSTKPENVLTVLAALLTFLGVNNFLVEYVGDVQQFATYEETDERYQRRKAVLKQSCAMMQHVLADPLCERVVVVGHSLGTAVALDTLLDLRRLNEATSPEDPMLGKIALVKIRQIVTLASPIDKINYFFATVQSRYHRYERVAEELRGDLSRPPFSKVGRQPHIDWVNFWDRGDIISGSIESLTGLDLRRQEIDNVQVAAFALPDPAASHSAYFEQAEVLDALYRIICRDRYRWVSTGPPAGGRAVEVRLGPGQGSALQSALFGLLLALPWLMAAAVLEISVGSTTWARWALVVVALPVGAGIVAHSLFGKGLERLRKTTRSQFGAGTRKRRQREGRTRGEELSNFLPDGTVPYKNDDSGV